MKDIEQNETRNRRALHYLLSRDEVYQSLLTDEQRNKYLLEHYPGEGIPPKSSGGKHKNMPYKSRIEFSKRIKPEKAEQTRNEETEKEEERTF